VNITYLVTDRTGQVLGDPISAWTSAKTTHRFNEPSSGEVTMPAWPEVMELLQPGHRLVMLRDKAVWLAGPMEEPADYSWKVGEGPGTVTVRWADDLARLAGYITWPAPAAAWTSQLGNAFRTLPNLNAESIIRQLVNENCGPSARTERRISGLTLGTVAGVGTTTSCITRFEPLLEVCRRTALAGGGIGFRTTQSVSGGFAFEVYAPADLTATARFSVGLGNLREFTYKRSAPTATHALVGGSETEESTTRAYAERANTAAAAAWWRMEKYVTESADTDTDGELTAAGNTELAEGGESIELTTVTVDTPDLRAGVDYGLGDLVTVALPHGEEITQAVRSISLEATPDNGERVSSLVGTPTATATSSTIARLQTMDWRFQKLITRRR
jgi:hypothetical protein